MEHNQAIPIPGGNTTYPLPITCNPFCWVPEPQFRGTATLLVTIFMPVLSTAFATTYMHASRRWWRRLLDFLLRVFFPEISLYMITTEEILRSKIVNELRSAGYSRVTGQQLMSIQRGLLLSVGHLSPPHHQGTNFNAVEVTWLPEEPDSAFGSPFEVKDYHKYKDMLSYLPTGGKTWKGIGYPDLGTLLLTLQLCWLMATIIVRLVSGLMISFLELYCLFALTAFVTERLITTFSIPAWNQPVIVRMPASLSLPEYPVVLGSTWKIFLLMLPGVQFAMWPIFMFVYGIKGPWQQSMTNNICIAAGGMYLSAAIYGTLGLCFQNAKWCRNICWFIALGAASASKFMSLGLGLFQVFSGEGAIFLKPGLQLPIPHISG